MVKKLKLSNNNNHRITKENRWQENTMSQLCLPVSKPMLQSGACKVAKIVLYFLHSPLVENHTGSQVIQKKFQKSNAKYNIHFHLNMNATGKKACKKSLQFKNAKQMMQSEDFNKLFRHFIPKYILVERGR